MTQKFTAEEVRATIAEFAEAPFPREEIDLEKVHEMLTAYADALGKPASPAGVPDGMVLVPRELPMLRVPEIKDMLAEEFHIYDCQARPLWAELLKIVAGVGIDDLLAAAPSAPEGDGGAADSCGVCHESISDGCTCQDEYRREHDSGDLER